jgi:hypothetical protein
MMESITIFIFVPPTKEMWSCFELQAADENWNRLLTSPCLFWSAGVAREWFLGGGLFC